MSSNFNQAFFTAMGLTSKDSRIAFFDAHEKEAEAIEEILRNCVSSALKECRAIVLPLKAEVAKLAQAQKQVKLKEANEKKALLIEENDKYLEKVRAEAVESHKASTQSRISSYISEARAFTPERFHGKEDFQNILPNLQRLAPQEALPGALKRVPMNVEDVKHYRKPSLYKYLPESHQPNEKPVKAPIVEPTPVHTEIIDLESSSDEDAETSSLNHNTQDAELIALQIELQEVKKSLSDTQGENTKLADKLLEMTEKLAIVEETWLDRFKVRAAKYQTMKERLAAAENEVEQLKAELLEFTELIRKRARK